jgi:Ran GTPase-activating protein (RanGAP) involved in mRNA processing and transport
MQENKTEQTKGWFIKLWRRVRRQPAEQHQHQTQDRIAAKKEAKKSSPKEINEVCQRLAYNDISVITLDLQDQSLRLEETAALSNALRINDNLRMLNVGNNSLGDEGILEILQGLQHHVSIEYLILSTNGIADVGEFAPLLVHMTSLKWLDLSHNEIHEAGALFQAVGGHSKLELLDLSVNQISDGAAIGQALQHSSSSINDLNLFGNRLGDDCAIAIANSGLKNLIKLNLGCNRIGNAGGKTLTKALVKSPTLKDLILTGKNPITDLEARASVRNAYAT